MEKLKKKTNEQSGVRKGRGGWGLWWEGFKEKVSFEFRVEPKRVGVMDNDSGDGTNKLRQFG